MICRICIYVKLKTGISDTHISVVCMFQLEAEDLPKLSEEYGITAVPTFIFIRVWYYSCANIYIY